MRTVLCIVLFGVLVLGAWKPANAQADELAQLALNIQKLNQFRQILSDMKKGYQIISKGYNTVKNLSQGNFDLHQTFLDGLLMVNPGVAKYRRITDIITMQKDVLSEYKAALHDYHGMQMFSSSELMAMEKVYRGLFDRTVENLEELLLVVTAGKLRMNDADRIAAIDRIYLSMKDKTNFLRVYNSNNHTLARQRHLQAEELNRIHSLYGR